MTFRGYGYDRPGIGFGPTLTEWVKVLIIVNVGVFIVEMISWGGFVRFFGLVPADAVGRLHVWQFVTYMFLHGGTFHLLINMFILWMFGSEMESVWGPRTFIRFYFFTGIGAGLFTWVLAPTSHVPTIGASGALYGLLLAFGMTFPNRPIYLYFLFPVPAKYMVILFGFLALVGSLGQGAGGIGYVTHLGGLIAGFVYLRWFGTAPWAKPRGRGWWDPASWREWLRKWRARRRLRVIDAQRRREAEHKRRVDEILEKIAREGMDSLTARERKILEKASGREAHDA